MTIPLPEQCRDMAQIRAAVSELDHEIIRMLGQRLDYVREAVRYKPDEDSIRNPDHWERFFADRRKWAAEAGYDPLVIEAMYRKLYEYTVQVQLELHRAKTGG
jgi:isochorismate pyruvate lyase